VEAIEYIHISLSIFHERYYWDSPSQYDENGAHHLAALSLVTWQDQSLLKTQTIYSAKKKDKFPHLIGYQKSMKVWTNQISIYNSAPSVFHIAHFIPCPTDVILGYRNNHRYPEWSQLPNGYLGDVQVSTCVRSYGRNGNILK